MVEPAQFSGRMPSRGPRSALVAAVLLVAFLGVAIAKPWEAPRPAVARTAGPSVARASSLATASPVATDTPAPDPLTPFRLAPPLADGAVWPALRWRALDPSEPLALIDRVVRWPGGYLAVGNDTSSSSALWASSDGVSWDAVPPGTASTLWPGLEVLDAAPLGTWLWVVTADWARHTTAGTMGIGLWRTADGRNWDAASTTGLVAPVNPQGRIMLAGTGRGLVLAWDEQGSTGGPAHAKVWTSADGTAWRAVAALPAGLDIQALATVPGGAVLAAGRTVSPRDGSSTPALLRSEDGREWERVDLPRDPGLAPGTGATVVWAILPASHGVLAVGDVADPLGHELWWRSADGIEWTVARGFEPLGALPCPESDPACGTYPAGLVAGDGTRLIAVGSQGDVGGRTWTSGDALGWTEAPALGPERPGLGDDLVPLPSGVLLRAGRGTWIGEVPSASQH